MPFIMKAGKALGERKAEVRIQFRNSSHLLHGQATEGMRNELVVRAPCPGCCGIVAGAPGSGLHGVGVWSVVMRQDPAVGGGQCTLPRLMWQSGWCPRQRSARG